MIYLSGCDCAAWRTYVDTDPIGVCNTPDISYTPASVAVYRHWCADNACYAHPNDFDLGAFLVWLARYPSKRCLFATAPDVVGDWYATLTRSLPVIPQLRGHGFKAAIVLQDGATPATMPDCDAVFVGGTTPWKTSIDAWRCVRHAHRRKLWVHMGRVNTLTRLRTARAMRCDSVDGTYVRFGPTQNAPRLVGWLRQVNNT